METIKRLLETIIQASQEMQVHIIKLERAEHQTRVEQIIERVKKRGPFRWDTIHLTGPLFSIKSRVERAKTTEYRGKGIASEIFGRIFSTKRGKDRVSILPERKTALLYRQK